MLSHWPIRYKLLFGVVTLSLIVAILSFSGFSGAYAFRRLARSISQRAVEMPAAAELTRSVRELRLSFRQNRPLQDIPSRAESNPSYVRGQFRTHFLAVQRELEEYKRQLEATRVAEPLIGDLRPELQTVREIERTLAQIEQINSDQAWVLDQVQLDLIGDKLIRLNDLTDQLPRHLQQRMIAFRDDVRMQYRTWIVLTWFTSILSAVLLVGLVYLFYHWVFHPLRILIGYSRKVAAGDFEQRVQLHSHDEMAELAGAMNAMTKRFEEIREDLKRQVRQRTKEVVRSEQLASVGFLAAGVAHEINNPLASIAWSAESLESRFHEYFDQDGHQKAAPLEDEIAVLQDYLRKIQDEAFRCKGITEKLLDFSRLGDVEKSATDLRDLVQDVIDMVQHLGQYRNKNIDFAGPQPVIAAVNAAEFKQVVLNLITNGLDSLEPGGTVWVELHPRRDVAELVVRDDGCGMTDEVLDQLFEPFFTRRRDGQGTGLGLSITYRIVNDHGGTITASSDGPQQGSCFHVTVPLSLSTANHEKDYQIA